MIYLTKHNIDILQDLLTVTTIPYNSLNNLLEKMWQCLCYSVIEQIKAGLSYLECDIHIGKICISVEDEQIRYRFIPDKQFDRLLIDLVNNRELPIVQMLEEAILTRIKNTYKEML